MRFQGPFQSSVGLPGCLAINHVAKGDSAVNSAGHCYQQHRNGIYCFLNGNEETQNDKPL